MAAFEKAKQDLERVGAKAVAASVDPLISPVSSDTLVAARNIRARIAKSSSESARWRSSRYSGSTYARISFVVRGCANGDWSLRPAVANAERALR